MTEICCVISSPFSAATNKGDKRKLEYLKKLKHLEKSLTLCKSASSSSIWFQLTPDSKKAKQSLLNNDSFPRCWGKSLQSVLYNSCLEFDKLDARPAVPTFVLFLRINHDVLVWLQKNMSQLQNLPVAWRSHTSTTAFVTVVTEKSFVNYICQYCHKEVMY